MEKTRKIAFIFTLAVAFSFVLVSLVQAEEKAKSLKWVEHKPNPRFAIHDAGTPTQEADDLVLDNKTGLIWARNANLAGKMLIWGDAITYCQNLKLGNLKGWRLPTKEELSSLIDPSQSVPALPSGYPFINVNVTYWSSSEISAESAWIVHIGSSGLVEEDIKHMGEFVLPVVGR